MRDYEYQYVIDGYKELSKQQQATIELLKSELKASNLRLLSAHNKIERFMKHEVLSPIKVLKTEFDD